MRTLTLIPILVLLVGCQSTETGEGDTAPHVPVYTSDIDHYWEAYDRIVATDDSLEKAQILQTLYFDRGTPGLAKLRETRNYTTEGYLAAIENYPDFWAAIRANTQRAAALGEQAQDGIAEINDLYPSRKPAAIYFGVGNFRSGGSAVDSFILIGSELAMADSTLPVQEFPERIREARATYFAGNPIDQLYGLFVHEYVHTQQEPIPTYLLGQCVYEGVAEFVSCTATGERPDTAVRFGVLRADSVRSVFRREMFYDNNQSKWLWGNTTNVFGQRDLGYFVGYAISQGYYERAGDKVAAIRELVEIDYADTAAVYRIIDQSGYFAEPVAEMAAAYRAGQPYVTDLVRTGSLFEVTFSEPMNTYWRNFRYGPGGEATLLRVKSVEGWDETARHFRFTVEDFPAGSKRELVIGPGFRDAGGAGLRPYLIEIPEE